MKMIRQSTATNIMVLMTESADHVTGIDGLTLTIKLSKDGGAFTSISPTVVGRGDGWYNIALTASHTNTLGDLTLHIDGGITADPTDVLMSVSDIFILVDELHQLEGLKLGSAMTVTPTTRVVGDISLVISGDGETITTVERT